MQVQENMQQEKTTQQVAPEATQSQQAPQETMNDPALSSKKEAESTQKILDVESIKDGIVVLKSQGMRSIIMCSSINFALMNEQEQTGKLYAYQDFLNSLNFPVQIVIQSKKLNIKRYVQKIKEAERVQENDHLRMQTGKYADFILSLVDLANITTNHFYVVIPYQNPLHKTQKGLMDSVTGFFSPSSKVQEKMSVFEIDKKELILRVQTVVSGLQGVGIKAAVLDTEEIIELLYSIYNPVIAQNQILGEIEKIRLENI